MGGASGGAVRETPSLSLTAYERPEAALPIERETNEAGRCPACDRGWFGGCSRLAVGFAAVADGGDVEGVSVVMEAEALVADAELGLGLVAPGDLLGVHAHCSGWRGSGSSGVRPMRSKSPAVSPNSARASSLETASQRA